VQRYWRSHYRPERAIFALAGDLDHALAEQLAAKLAGAWPGSHRGASTDGAPPTRADLDSSQRLSVEQMDRQRVELQVGCRAPSFPKANRAEQEALASLAGGGKGSRLNRVLLQERGLLLQASAFNWLHRTDGMLAVAASAQPDRAVEAAKALVDELISLKDATEHECMRAINYTRGEYARSLAEPLGSATRVAEEALWVTEAPSRAADKAAFEHLTPDGLRAAAAHFFTRESLCMAVVGPGVELASYERCLA
jgi:predicted Zn-dependent peptidase